MSTSRFAKGDPHRTSLAHLTALAFAPPLRTLVVPRHAVARHGRGSASPPACARLVLLPPLPRAFQVHAPHRHRVRPAARPTEAEAVSGGGTGGEPRRRHGSADALLRRPDAVFVPQVFVPPHPLIKHWVSVLRNEQTPCAIFKSAMAELGRLLIYEASRDWLPTITGEIQTPVAVSSVEFVDPREPGMVVPMLRAGLAMAENASSILPATKTYHLGQRRDEETLQPSIYLNNLPDKIPEGTRVLVVDPMLATGGTIVAAIDLLVERGVTSKQIKVVSAVAAPPALQKLSNKFPGFHVYTGTIDSEVDERGFIVPGLGDASERSFAT